MKVDGSRQHSSGIFVDTKRRLQCQPGTLYMEDNCNWCRCTRTGLPICTKVLCAGTLKNTMDIDSDDRNPLDFYSFQPFGNKVCVPGSTYGTADCNVCKCSNDGKDFVCTNDDCGLMKNSAHPRERRSAPSPEKTCAPNSAFMRDCNFCTCDGRGREACTKMECIGGRSKRSAEVGVQCLPGSQFPVDCNRCECRADGKPFCTKKICRKHKHFFYKNAH